MKPVLEWLERDAKFLLLARGLRSFAYGFLSVILAIYLSLIGFSGVVIGIVLTTSLAGSALITILSGMVVDRVGRRTMLKLFAILMLISGVVFILTTNFAVIILAAILGTLSPTGTEVGPFLSIEQVIIPQTCEDERRTDAFAYYNLAGYFPAAFGALAGGLPFFLLHIPTGELAVYRMMFVAYGLFGLATFIVYLFLSEKVELKKEHRTDIKTKSESDARIARFALLFSLDAFAGGFIVQSIISYWFYVQFGLDMQTLSVIFFMTSMLTALSFLIAPKLAKRIGLLSTAVITHLISNVLLALVPFAPSLVLAVTLLFLRHTLSQMDVPTRQSYLVAVIEPEKRTIATSTTNTARNLAQSITPSISGAVMTFSLAAPFVLSGTLKGIYDLMLYLTFRKIKPPEER